MTTRSSVKNLFVYGTLTGKSLVHQLTGKHFCTSPAVLRDFRKLRSRFGYPYIIPHKGSKVEGLLMKGVDPESIRKFDWYEGENRLYFRRKLTVVSQGKRVPCEVYVGNAGRLHLQS